MYCCVKKFVSDALRVAAIPGAALHLCLDMHSHHALAPVQSTADSSTHVHSMYNFDVKPSAGSVGAVGGKSGSDIVAMLGSLYSHADLVSVEDPLHATDTVSLKALKHVCVCVCVNILLCVCGQCLILTPVS